MENEKTHTKFFRSPLEATTASTLKSMNPTGAKEVTVTSFKLDGELIPQVQELGMHRCSSKLITFRSQPFVKNLVQKGGPVLAQVSPSTRQLDASLLSVVQQTRKNQQSEKLSALQAEEAFLTEKLQFFRSSTRALAEASEALRRRARELEEAEACQRRAIEDTRAILNEKRQLSSEDEAASLNCQNLINLTQLDSTRNEARQQELEARFQAHQGLVKDVRLEAERAALQRQKRLGQITELQAEACALESKVKALSNKTRNAEHERQRLEKQCQRLEAEIEDLNESLIEKESHNAGLFTQQHEFESLADEFLKIRVKYSERLTNLVLVRSKLVTDIKCPSEAKETGNNPTTPINHPVRRLF